MRSVWLLVVTMGTLAGCGSPAECGEAECAAVCAEKPAPAPEAKPEPAGESLSDFEKGLVSPILEDIRGGVRPFDETGIGICKGTKSCDEFLGASPGELPPGKYMVRAEVRVPKAGEKGTWKLAFDTECTTTRKTDAGETTSTSNYNRSYDVRFAGEDRGYRLQPLRTIESPNRGGSRECTYKITAPHPDGDKVFEGSWKVPAAE